VRHDPIDPTLAGGGEPPAGPGWRRTRIFRDRAEAGRLLAGELERLVRAPAIVAAIPPGGVAVAAPVVERLAVPLTVVYTRKLTVPWAPERAFGAVDEEGQAVVDRTEASRLGLGPGEVETISRRVVAEIERQAALYRVPPLGRFLPGASVILVDEGLATGFTMAAAVAYARRRGAREVVVAAPCASARAAQFVGSLVDRLVALVVDDALVTVRAHYVDLAPVTDDAVVTVLERLGSRRPLEAAG
jgi:predicted phosphoribosyltransferase